ncbi:MAG: molybdopterin synthase sulfur carrier subunit [Chloroflexi bacterium]|nr:MAG: molybdopterin synthase sulfur carrier subunit [Chloroflexota bacterium]
MPVIRIPPPFRNHTGGKAEVKVSSATAGEALDALLQRHPTLRDELYDADGNLITTTSESINVLLGKYDIRELQGRDTPLDESSRLMILRTWPAAISGGDRDA